MKIHTMRRGHLVAGATWPDPAEVVAVTEGSPGNGTPWTTYTLVRKTDGAVYHLGGSDISPASEPMIAGVGDWVKFVEHDEMLQVVHISYASGLSPALHLKGPNHTNLAAMSTYGRSLSREYGPTWAMALVTTATAVYSDKEGKHCISHDEPRYYFRVSSDGRYDVWDGSGCVVRVGWTCKKEHAEALVKLLNEENNG